GATDRETGRPVIPRSSTAERPAVNRQVIGSSPIAGAPGRARRKRTGGPNRVPDPGCEKDGESGREHPAKALGWRRPAGPYRPGTPAIPRSSTAERPAVNRQVIGSSPIAGAMRSKVLPVGEGPALPSPTTTLKGHAPRAAPHTSPTTTLKGRSGGTACPLPVPEGVRRGHGWAESYRAETTEGEPSIAPWHLVGAGNVRCDRQSTPTLHLDESGSLQPPTGEERLDLGL